jgi:hypothetical protein
MIARSSEPTVRAIRITRVLWILGMVLVGAVGVGPGEASAQDISCAPPRYTEEQMLERLVRLGEAPDGGSRVHGQIVSRMVPLSGCAFIPPVEDPEALMVRLVDLAASEGSPGLADGVFTAVAVLSQRQQDPIAPPLDALVAAVETGRTQPVRGLALWRVLRFGDKPEVRSQVLDWARAERGPPEFPDLPDRVYRNLNMGGIPGGSEALEELSSDPGAIQNPAVRCRIQNRHLEPYSADPNRPTLRTECPPLAFEDGGGVSGPRSEPRP